MRTRRTLIVLCCFLRVAGVGAATLSLGNAQFTYSVSADGRNLSFVDRTTGKDYLRGGTPSVCALVRRAGKEFPATQAAFDGRLHLAFGEAGTEATLRVESRPTSVQLTVESVSGAEIDSLVFLNVPLTLQGQPDEPFGACALSLNLITRVDQLPALQSELRAATDRKFGLVGGRVALVGAPMAQVLPALKEVLIADDELPHCPVAGPWAGEIPFNHGSYLFNFGSLTEGTVEDWIAMAQSLGFTQIDNHGGSAAFFRFGDFELNRQKWPEGWEAYRRIVARLHAAGIGSIFHTYAFFLDKHSKYVTPVPDNRLAAFRTFTLAAAISPDAGEIPVNESTANISTVTGFFEHNSVVLHLGDELVTFSGASRQPPWRFTGVKRGVLGTKASAHGRGTAARHLKECFGLFVPDPESSLFLEIAANHAAVVNACNFDGIYLDAIDGSSILGGADECWYWADQFVCEIQRRLKKPVGMEMSAMWHHFWPYRTRWQAWDYPQRGHERFIDLHAQAVHGGLLLPLHLGWWNFQSFNPPQIEPTYPEVMEYLVAKLVGWDAGISLTGGVDRNQLRAVPLFQRVVDILRKGEELRASKTVDEATKAKLREPGEEFSLFTDDSGQTRFRRLKAAPHVVALAEPWSLSWKMVNPFDAQPFKLRLEALMSAAPYDDPAAMPIADLAAPDTTNWHASAAQGVTCSRAAVPADVAAAGALLEATNHGQVPRQAAWARYQRQFSPNLNLRQHQALGLWVEGDGQGELLAIRLESPQHLSFGAIADRYLPINFAGRRLVTLVETESSHWSDYVWNDGKSLYNAYRETIDFGAIESVSVWLQNLPANQEVKCRLSPIRALPLRAQTVKDPRLTLNGATVVFPVELASGSWLECNGPDDCTLYGPKGDNLGKVTPRGNLTSVRAGENQIEFSCAPLNGPSPRARVTVFSSGPAL